MHNFGLLPLLLYVPYNRNLSYLILVVEQFELIIYEAVLGALFLPQRPFLLQLGTPERLDAVHAGPQLLIRQLQFLLEVPQLPLQIRVLVLQFPDKHPAGIPERGRLPG